jgi:subtilisin family serine protease
MKKPLCLVALCVAVYMFVPASAQQGNGRFRRSEARIQNSYIVVLDADAPGHSGDFGATAAQLLRGMGGARLGHVYSHALSGFSAQMSEAQAMALSNHPSVAYVEEDGIVQAFTTQPNPPSWGLDRIDQVNRPLDNSYSYTSQGTGVTAYIIDTGIRVTHVDFGGRASIGFDAVGDGQNGNDCHGHGTHVAGTVGGTLYGVAKNVTLKAVRVLNCAGSGSNSGVIAGINWVTSNHGPGQPAVANMSLGGGASGSLDNAVKNSIADGVTYAVAAGNSNFLAQFYSPARVSEAITVGATTSSDAKASYSNYGSGVDIFAPGSAITSAWNTSNTATNTINGTSMATPHVAGVAARYLQNNTGASPATVRNAIVNAASLNKITGLSGSTPNRLLFWSGSN